MLDRGRKSATSKSVGVWMRSQARMASPQSVPRIQTTSTGELLFRRSDEDDFATSSYRATNARSIVCELNEFNGDHFYCRPGEANDDDGGSVNNVEWQLRLLMTCRPSSRIHELRSSVVEAGSARSVSKVCSCTRPSACLGTVVEHYLDELLQNMHPAFSSTQISIWRVVGHCV